MGTDFQLEKPCLQCQGQWSLATRPVTCEIHAGGRPQGACGPLGSSRGGTRFIRPPLLCQPKKLFESKETGPPLINLWGNRVFEE